MRPARILFLFGFLCLLPTAQAATYSLVSSTCGGLGATGGTSAQINTTGATLLIAVATSAAVPSVADSKSNGWTALTTYGTGGPYTKMFYVTNPTSVGTGHTVTVTGTYAGVCFAAFSGANLAVSFDAQQNGNSGGANQPGSITPAENNALVIGSAGSNTAVAPSTPGMTMLGNWAFTGGAWYGGGAAYTIQTTATAINPTWAGGGPNGLSVASFKPSLSTSQIRHRVIGGY